jgi:hypothetical protein
MSQCRFATLLGLLFSATLLTGCESLPPTATTAPVVAVDSTTVTKPKRIKEVLVIEHVTCDPAQAKKLQAEIDKREAERKAKGISADPYLSKERVKVNSNLAQ